MAIIYKNRNFARSTLADNITIGQSSLGVATGHGTRFPSSGYFLGVLWGAAYASPWYDSAREVVIAEASSGDAFTLHTRGAENTSAKAWTLGDNFALVVTAGKLDELESEINAKATSGANSNITSLLGLTTPLSIAGGGTAATTATLARTSLGLAIGADVAAYSHTHSYLADVVNDTTPQLGGDLDLNASNVAMVSQPASDHTASGLIANMIVGETLAIGQVCYIKSSDGRCYKADSDNATPILMPAVCIALEAGSAGDTKKFLFHGFFRDDTYAWTVNAILYVSGDPTTTGGLTATVPTGANNWVQAVAIATHADRIFFNPSLTLVQRAS